MSDPTRDISATQTRLPIDRRRLLGAISGGALLAALRPPVSLAQPATPEADQLAQLRALSQTLCGGGAFDDARTQQLAALLAGDEALSAGLEELLASGTATPSAGTRSANAQAAAQEILLFWYTGEFKGEPVPNHADVYTQLVAWQAMYTPAWTTCKVYGEWANPPTMTPQQPEIA
jgi:hypothetical protein